MKDLVDDPDTFPAAVRCPEGGDARTAASVEVGLQDCADRAAYLKKKLTQAVLDVPLVPVVNQAGSTPDADPYTSAQFSWSHVVYFRGWNQEEATDGAGYLVFDFPPLPPEATTIVSVTAYVSAFGHSGLPATKPIVYFSSVVLADGTLAEVSQADTSANQPAYDTFHSIELVVNHAIDPGEKYWIRFTGETGANSIDKKLTLLAIRVTVE
jgi:hypothetical protein